MQFLSFLRPVFGKLIWRVNTKSKLIYLTFDDGPVPEVTIPILDILDKYGWKATFFCVGDNVRKHPDVYREVLKRGHRVGNHTFNHIKACRNTTRDYIANVKKASEYIDSHLFRPPHGILKFSQIRALKKEYDIVMWDLITFDYNRKKKPDQIMKTVQKHLRAGSIVVFHDSVKAKDNVLSVLPEVLAFWKSEGYDFGLL